MFANILLSTFGEFVRTYEMKDRYHVIALMKFSTRGQWGKKGTEETLAMSCGTRWGEIVEKKMPTGTGEEFNPSRSAQRVSKVAK